MIRTLRYSAIFIIFGLQLSYTFAQKTETISGVDFSKYHSYAEVESALKSLADRYSDLARVYSIGESFAGRELWLIEVANTKAKAANEKPAVFVCGGLSGEELAGVEVSLHTAAHILETYGNDEKVRELVDAKTFYILPCANPDATETTRSGPYAQRNNLRPLDNDKDEKLDEDGPDDIDKDGYILQMRVKDEKGEWIIDDADKRLMKKADTKKGEKGEYKLYETEGIDNDGDGKINEDGTGGINLDKNWPAGWTMQSRWSENGQYPLSEPETRAIIDFLVEHRNVAMIQSFAPPGSLSPAKGKSDPQINAKDLAFLKKLAEKYKELVGKDSKHPYLGGKRTSGGGRFFEWAYIQYGALPFVSELWELPEVKETKEEPKKENKSRRKTAQLDSPIGNEAATTKVAASIEAGGNGSSDEGNGKDPEKSQKTAEEKVAAKPKVEKEEEKKAAAPTQAEIQKEVKKAQTSKEGKPSAAETKKKPSEKKTEKKKESPEVRWLKWNDVNLKGEGFINWKPFKHPKLGDVELGGWKKLIRSNPPAHQLKDIGEKHAKFILHQAAQTPSVSVKEINLSVIDAAIGASETTKKVENGTTLISVDETKSEGAGEKPRILAEVKTVIENNGELPTGIKDRQGRPVRAEFTCSNNVSLVRGSKIVRLGTISGKGGTKEAKWIVKILGTSAWVQVKVVSEKGGTDVKRLPIEVEVKP